MEPTSSGSIADAARLAIREVEELLIVAIQACETDIQRASTDLERMKTALKLLQRDVQTPKSGDRITVKTPLKKPIVRRAAEELPRDLSGSAASIIRAFVRVELRKAGHPLNRSEILERLNKEGVSIDVAAPIKRIAKVMWSSPEFVNSGDGYWFAGEPLPRRPEKT
jgi:hypothetical protein